MLIDSSHPEETRVVVLDGQKVEEFDFEAAAKRPLKGNIYLAKVTRVEPSLQAAFVEYGGNRQGFLAFSEIHPDYYQIPVADRQALIAEQQAEARRRGDEEFESVETAKAGSTRPSAESEADDEDAEADDDGTVETVSDDSDGGTQSFYSDNDHPPRDLSDDEADADGGEDEPANHFDDETIAPATTATETSVQQQRAQRPSQRWVRRRHYKIQEVVKRRQVMLVQVVKEERGNKGAALTTYLSLAGRYCVLMPNTPRGGGISRKITNAADRKRLKSAAASLELPDGMGLIIRTAGANRTKLEIKRDYEYLLRMWDSIRELTLKSNAPACVYEEGDLIKRAIRDLYNKDVSEVVVEGEDGYRNAKDFMRMLMPSHAKNVKPYKETAPLFHRHHIEAQLDAMFSPTVTLRSGGYIVINQTEALVSIDVNSGRATREHNIEDTAYKTNLEAAEEIARQLRLRDLAGLIVIDFIDMEDSRNDRNVEKRLRDCVKNDRARVQIGKISQFGLLEMSRQRLRAGVIAGSTIPCPHCAGQGIVRSVESTALRVLRGLEEEGQKQRAAAVTLRVPAAVAIYTLNQKRRELMRIEADYGMSIAFEPDETVTAGNFEIERTQQRAPEERVKSVTAASNPVVAEEPEEEEEVTEEPPSEERPVRADGEQGNGGRRRRRRRRGRDRDRPAVMQETVPIEGETEFDAETALEIEEVEIEASTVQPTEGDGRRKRRRRRRGRRGRRENGAAHGESATDENLEGVPVDESVSAEGFGGGVAAPVTYDDVPVPNAPSEPLWSLATEEGAALPQIVPEAPQPADGARAAMAPEPDHSAEPEPAASPIQPEATAEPEVAVPTEPEVPAGPPRKGWWQRPFRARE
jgi:ribonuclease E